MAEIESFKIVFPPYAVFYLTRMIFRVFVDCGIPDLPEDWAVISPMIECGPSGYVFEKSLSFEVPVWCRPRNLASAYVLSQSVEGEKWVMIQKVTLDLRRKVEFSCNSFSRKVVVTKKDEDIEYILDYFLFTDNMRLLRSAVCVANETAVNRLKNDFKNDGLTSIFSGNDNIFLSPQTKVDIKIYCDESTIYNIKPAGGHQLTITDAFKRGSEVCRCFSHTIESSVNPVIGTMLVFKVHDREQKVHWPKSHMAQYGEGHIMASTVNINCSTMANTVIQDNARANLKQVGTKSITRVEGSTDKGRSEFSRNFRTPSPTLATTSRSHRKMYEKKDRKEDGENWDKGEDSGAKSINKEKRKKREKKCIIS